MDLFSLLLDAVFPRICCHCKKIGTLLCQKCYSELEFSHQSIETDQLSFLQACTQFGEVSSSIVHTLKYESVKDLGALCAQIMYLSCHFPDTDFITAIPLHKKRRAQRGFNQAEVIAVELGRLMSIKYVPFLLRNKETINFAKVTDKDEREKLSDNLFSINEEYSPLIKNRSTLIIDDVWTTGATLNSAAQVLVFSGAVEIKAMTFTHGI